MEISIPYDTFDRTTPADRSPAVITENTHCPMKRSLLLADLWKMLRETQLKIEIQILPQLADPDLYADPTGELSQTLSLSANGIEQYFKAHKLVDEKRTSSSERGHKGDTNCPTRSGAGCPECNEESIRRAPPLIPTEDLPLDQAGWSADYSLPTGNTNSEVEANIHEIAERWINEKTRTLRT